MIDDLYRLKYITRYSNAARVNDEDVAQHSFYVSCLCIGLVEEFPEADLGKMLMMATVHDWPEAVIDDIAHSTKRDYPDVAKALKVAELEVIKKYPQSVQDAYADYEAGESLEAKLVKLADIQQCLMYLNTEMELGNTTVYQMWVESKESEKKQQEAVYDIYKRLYCESSGK